MKGDKLFNDIVPAAVDLFGEVDPVAPKKPGRNMELAIDRDRKIAARLYYYRSTFPLVKNDIIMKLMCQDFHLSPIRIKEVLDELDVELERLKHRKPPLKWFKERWPRMVWSTDFPQFDKTEDIDTNK